MITVYVHPSCYSSYLLLKALGKKLSGVEFKALRTPQASLSRGIVSVPWVEVGGVPAAADPVEAEEVEQMALGSYSPRPEPEQAFLKALLGSSFASSLSLLHGDVFPAISEALVSAAIRAPYSGLPVREVAQSLRRSSKALYEAVEDKLARAVSMTYVRELYWAGSAEVKVDRAAFSSWLLAKASIGRAGLPLDPREKNEKGIDIALSLLESEKEKMMERVRREQSTIYGDREYLELVMSIDQI
ncbi:MAG: hypothetical protein N3F67_04280 [Acidilobaceae archaeon]|nr:hypothetical protein [Acidilobaceae archaeon]